MASIDKVKVGETTYDISPSKDGTLNGYTSGDSASPSSWSSVSAISTSDTNATIFNKLTTMVKNVRWLHAKLGDTDFSATGQDTVSGALVSLKTGLGNKADSDHSHTVADLPVTSNQSNSTSTIPTCALLYSMNQELDALEESANNIINIIDDPNKRYESKNLGTWSSTSDVTTFLTRFNNSNRYSYGATKLKLGNYVTIQDGTYNAQWEIAGFDCEHNQTAADDTVYDNGYGICLIPKTQVTTGKWNTDEATISDYKSSYMHKTVLPGIVTKLKTVLGNHIVNRNVLLSSSLSNDGSSASSSAYAWTAADATLMSIGQMNGTFASHDNKYDDGEANYKLPLFNYEAFKTSSNFWSRGVYSSGDIWIVSSSGSISTADTGNAIGVRPLIYLR